MSEHIPIYRLFLGTFPLCKYKRSTVSNKVPNGVFHSLSLSLFQKAINFLLKLR